MIGKMPRLLALAGASLATAAPAQHVVSRIDLSPAFGAPPGWSFLATQGPDTSENESASGGAEPGQIRLCITRDDGRSCRPELRQVLEQSTASDHFFSEPHYLNDARIIRPRPGLPMLLIQAASLHSGDGDQIVATLAFTWNRARNTFVQVFEKHVGHNRNEEIRYVANGPLRGALISADPTENAPYGYWITVNRLSPSGPYRQILRYRSSTHYGDGNPLAVIDSEMPAIRQRLGLWRPGRPLPLPAHACARPHMIGQELWC